MNVVKSRSPVAPLFLRGCTAVVTGVAGYLGKIFSEALLEAGATVVLMGRGGNSRETPDGCARNTGARRWSTSRTI